MSPQSWRFRFEDTGEPVWLKDADFGPWPTAQAAVAALGDEFFTEYPQLMCYVLCEESSGYPLPYRVEFPGAKIVRDLGVEYDWLSTEIKQPPPESGPAPVRQYKVTIYATETYSCTDYVAAHSDAEAVEYMRRMADEGNVKWGTLDFEIRDTEAEVEEA